MKETKYIVYESGWMEEMMIFGATQQHGDVAIQLGVRDKIISAGFLSIDLTETDGDPTVTAYGKSISLGIESRPEVDTVIAKRVLGLGDNW